MFKFIHCADLHLDSPLRGLAVNTNAPEDQLRSATRRALENLVTLSIREKIRFLLIAGDIFDGDWQDYNTGLFFNACMGRLNTAGIPVYRISGNHDAAGTITRNLVDPPNVFRFSVDHPETKIIEELKVAIHGQGFKDRAVHEDLTPLYPLPLPGYLNIGLLHTSVQGQVGHDPYAPCRLYDLEAKGYDYWALGHIHLRQVLKEKPYIVYPGNIQGRHIGETGAKGCTLVTVNDGAVSSVEHQDLDVLRWIECTINLEGAKSDDDFYNRVAAATSGWVEKNTGLSLVIRFTITGQTELHGKILARPAYYRAEMENAVNNIPSAQIWFEKILFKTQPLPAAQLASHPSDAEVALDQTLTALSSDKNFLQDVLSQAQSLQLKLGGQNQKLGLTRMEAAADVQKLLQDAKDLLTEMMAEGSGIE